MADHCCFNGSSKDSRCVYYALQYIQETAGPLQETNLRENRDAGSKVQVVFYKASVEDADVRLCIAAGWIEASSMENITEEQIMLCVKSQGHRLLDGGRSYLINDCIKTLEMRMNFVQTDDRAWTFH